MSKDSVSLTEARAEALEALAQTDLIWDDLYDDGQDVLRALMRVVRTHADVCLQPPTDEEVRQFVFDIIVTECGMDESDPDDQTEASERVDAWMRLWAARRVEGTE